MREKLEAAQAMGATPADIPGLWNLPGYPELTTAQLMQVIERAPAEALLAAIEKARTV